MGSTICTAGFPSAAIASSCFTARCDSIWYGFFIATLLFSAKENSLSAYQGWERGVATFYDLPGIPAPSDIEPMHRFELTSCYRLADGASGVIRSDTLVNSESPQCVSQVWQINEADIQLTNALYPIAQEAMRRGYYMPNRGSVHCSRHQCPHWRRCEQDFGGVVEA